jgi:hypothetical protein
MITQKVKVSRYLTCSHAEGRELSSHQGTKFFVTGVLFHLKKNTFCQTSPEYNINQINEFKIRKYGMQSYLVQHLASPSKKLNITSLYGENISPIGLTGCNVIKSPYLVQNLASPSKKPMSKLFNITPLS